MLQRVESSIGPVALIAIFFLAFGANAQDPPKLPDTPKAPSWKLDYFYDKDRSSLTVTDAVFVSPTKAILAGTIEEKQKQRSVIGHSLDAGKTWSFENIKEVPVALFFLNETQGWMATQKSIQATSDGGRTWKRQNPLGGMRRLYFLDAKRGFAIGAPKAAFETRDGGDSWVPIEEAQKPQSNPDYTAYETIDFAAGKYGVIFGSSYPARAKSPVPDWIDPQRAASIRQVPTLTILLSTIDGGENWKSSTAPLFGHPVSTTISKLGFGLTVFRYDNQFEVPSEVYRTELTGSAKISIAFRQKDRLVTDAYIRDDGTAFLAAVEPPGAAPVVAIPAKIKMLIARDGKTFLETKVDYRATARSILFCPFGNMVWAFTDTGMLLRLVE